MNVSVARHGIDDFYVFVPGLAITAEEFAYLVTGSREGEEFQDELGKLKKGLGINRKAVNPPCKDTVAMAKDALDGLVKDVADRRSYRYVLVATESQRDLAKPTASYFEKQMGHNNYIDADILNACDSSGIAIKLASNQPEKGYVVTSDMAKYGMKGKRNSLSADFTGGSGAVAMSFGDGRLIKLYEQYGAYTSDQRDFFKPLRVCGDDVKGCMSPVVYGESKDVYTWHVGQAYKDFKERTGASLDEFGLILFHVPYPGITKYGYQYIRAIDRGEDERAGSLLREVVELFGNKRSMDPESYAKKRAGLCKDLKQELGRFHDKEDYDRRVGPSLKLASEVGNLYTGSLPLAMVSALMYGEYEPGTKMLFNYYASGANALTMAGEVGEGASGVIEKQDILKRLDSAYKLNEGQYVKLRELGLLSKEQMEKEGMMEYMPSSGSYLAGINEDGSSEYLQL